MTNVNNPAALLRSLIVYAICVPLAIIVGFLVTNPQDYQSIGFIGALVSLMVFPLFMKWHYPLLVFSCATPITVFFLPGRPTLFIFMIAVSLTISVVERILNRNQKFLSAPSVTWPLLAMLGVVYLTGKLTGGFGVRALGSDVYGGKKYIFLIVGILSFFAFISRPIPKKDANLYITLYFAGGFLNAITDSFPFMPGALHGIYLLIPPSIQAMSTMGDKWQLGVTRLSGIAGAAGSLFYLMLAKHGIRDNLLTRKLWRPVLLAVTFVLMFLGGFRTSVLGLVMIVGTLFWLEKLHRTGLMVVVILGGFLAATLVVPLAPHLPYTFQRAIAFVPGLDISAQARMDTEASTQWRLGMWSALLPQVPKYLLLGKGYAFSQETYNDSMSAGAMFSSSIDPSQDPLALSSDFHSGPLSVVISFGIWGVLVWLWYWVAGFWVVWRNYRYGDPALRHINVYIFAAFMVKVVIFLFIFGGIVEDVGGFAALLGLSVALNHGVMRPKPAPRVNPVFAKPRLPFPVRPALQQ